MIKISADFDLNDLNNIIDDEVTVWFDELSSELFESGKTIIDAQIAKVKTGPFTGGGFGNITYNLRSSMGVGLVVNNQIESDYFPYGNGNEGQKHGKDLLRKIAAEVSEEICLVVVAGELYGVYVQAKGYDVIEMAKGTLPATFLSAIGNG